MREEWEYEEYNIGARNIPLSVFMNRLEELQDLKDQEVIVHCKMGGRSSQAAQVLHQLGFAKVKNLSGGMEEWKKHFGHSDSSQLPKQ